MSRLLVSRLEVAHAELFGQRNLEAIPRFFAPDYVAHATGKDVRGHAFVRRFLAELWGAFPRLDVKLEILAEGKGRVSWQRTLRGVQKGAYRGFPASGRRITWRDLATSRFEDGRIVEDWVVTDLAEQLLRARKR